MIKKKLEFAQGMLGVRNMVGAKPVEDQRVNLAEIFGSRGVDVTGVDM